MAQNIWTLTQSGSAGYWHNFFLRNLSSTSGLIHALGALGSFWQSNQRVPAKEFDCVEAHFILWNNPSDLETGVGRMDRIQEASTGLSPSLSFFFIIQAPVEAEAPVEAAAAATEEAGAEADAPAEEAAAAAEEKKPSAAGEAPCIARVIL